MCLEKCLKVGPRKNEARNSLYFYEGHLLLKFKISLGDNPAENFYLIPFRTLMPLSCKSNNALIFDISCPLEKQKSIRSRSIL